MTRSNEEIAAAGRRVIDSYAAAEASKDQLRARRALRLAEAEAADKKLVDDMVARLAAIEPALAVDVSTSEDPNLARALRQEQSRSLARRVTKALEAHAAAGDREPASVTDGSDFFAEPDDEEDYIINLLWPKDGNVVLVAQWKSGKTTFSLGVARSLITGEPFLGRGGPVDQLDTETGFAVTPMPEGKRVAVFDFELPRQKLRQWMRDIGLNNHADRLVVETFRGQGSRFNIKDEQIRSDWARVLREKSVDKLILDPFAKILSACGATEESNNTEVGEVLNAIDALKEEGEVSELLLVHHMGHNGERGRGASRLRDWPDAEWKLIRESDENGEPVPNATRFFSALGRDVEFPEKALGFDKEERRMWVTAEGRREAISSRAAAAVLKAVRAKPGSLSKEIEDAVRGVGIKQKPFRDALKALVDREDIHTRRGVGSSIHHYSDCECKKPEECVRGASDTDAEAA